MLIRPIERIDVVVCPSSRSRSLVVLIHIRNHHIAQLRSESQMVNNMREGMAVVLDVVVQIMNMQISIRETLSRGNVEVSDNLVDGDGAFESATFFALCVEVFGVVLALALFDAFATAE